MSHREPSGSLPNLLGCLAGGDKELRLVRLCSPQVGDKGTPETEYMWGEGVIPSASEGMLDHPFQSCWNQLPWPKPMARLIKLICECILTKRLFLLVPEAL